MSEKGIGTSVSNTPWILHGAAPGEIKAFVDEVVREAGRAGNEVAPALIPSIADIATLVDIAMWATTIADEGRYPRFSLLFGPPPAGAICTEDRPLTAKNIASLSPALLTGLSRIGVHRHEGNLRIWGLLPGHTSCFEVLGIAPAYVLVRMGPHNVAAFRRNEYMLLIKRDPAAGSHGLGREHFAAIVAGAFASTLAPTRRALTGVLLLMIAEAMRSQGNGGTLLVVPEDQGHQREALAWIDLGPNGVGGISLENCFEEYEPRLAGAEDPLERAASMPEIGGYLSARPGADPNLIQRTAVIGRLSAIDGVIVLTERLELLGFGAMIRAPLSGKAILDSIHRRSLLHYSDPAKKGEDVPIRMVGGARRQSAARFVANNYDSLAITASHDGPVSLGMWVARDPDTEGPRAHLITEIEILLD